MGKKTVKSNNKSGKKGYSYSKGAKRPSVLFLLPLMAVLGVVPLVTYLYTYDCGLEYFDFFLIPEDYYANGGSADFFLHWKMVTFVSLAAVMACIIVYKLISEKRTIKFTKIFIPLGVYGLLALISSIASEYRHYSFVGIYDQFEPVWALLGYCVVAYYAFLYVNSAEDLKLLIKALIFSMVIMLFIGLTQAFFTDFFKTNIGAHMILPSIYFDADGNSALNFAFEEGRVYMTLYNPNYVGSYVALLSPLFVMLAFATDKKWKKFVFGGLAVGLILALLGSQSRAGFVGVFAAILLMLVAFNRKLLKYWFPVALVAIILVGTVVTYDNYKNGLIRNKIKSAFSVSETEYALSEIQTLDDETIITYKGNNLHLAFDYYQLPDNPSQIGYDMKMYDDSMQSVEASIDSASFCYTIVDERFENIKVYIANVGNEIGFIVSAAGSDWAFVHKDDTYYMYSSYGKFVKSVTSESSKWLGKHGQMASGRGFIWAKTIPLLKDYIFLGSGADTFVLVFPNNDFLGMYNGGYSGQIMTKPHNMYLQIAVQTGVLSLIAFLVYYCWFFFFGLITCFRLRSYDYTAFVGVGILTGTFGYMVVQIINDSMITVAPLYWLLTGVGIAAFTMARKSEAYAVKLPKAEIQEV